MRALWYDSFGSADDVLRVSEFDTPSPGSGEVRVRLSFSGVNPSDAKARAGGRPGVPHPPYPRIIPHSDGAGVIDAIGPGVETSRLGERVWIWNGQWQRAFGTAAEYIALPSEQAVALPEGVALQTGATLGIPALTAAHTVFGGGSVQGKTLLISGGAGAVGRNAVQLARWGGAQVLATASPSAHKEVLDAGAHAVFDYKDPELAARVADAAPDLVDRAVEVEFGQNATLLAEVMAPLGTIAAYGSGKNMTPTLPFGSFLFKALKIDITLIYVLPGPERQTAISMLHEALTSGALNPQVHDKLSLAEGARAHDLVMRKGRAGAVLLEI
ncbi:MAG: NADPH:quinone reductase [Pseudomonadota bacterium]